MKSRTDKFFLSVSLALAAYMVAQLFGFLGFILIGAGHGSGLLGYLFFSPTVNIAGHWFYLGLFIWPLVGFMIPWAGSVYISSAIMIFSGVGYYGVIRDISDDLFATGTTYFFVKVYETLPDLVCLIILVFVLMQASIWISVFFMRMKKSKS